LVNEQLESTSTVAAPNRPRPDAWPIDILKGMLIGDFAENLGSAGYLTQGILGFIPIIGTCCAARDLLANIGKGDKGGVILNAIALLPVLGGISKMARALRSIAVRGIREAGEIYGAATTVGHSLPEDSPPHG
jgi:hypothetical protein